MTSGYLTLENGEVTWELVDPLTLMAVSKNAVVNVHKVPDKGNSVFSSVFLRWHLVSLQSFISVMGKKLLPHPQ